MLSAGRTSWQASKGRLPEKKRKKYGLGVKTELKLAEATLFGVWDVEMGIWDNVFCPFRIPSEK